MKKLCYGSLAISVLALIVALKGKDLIMHPDSIITILTFLITLLIGWQILNIVQLKEFIRKTAHEEIDSITKDYKYVLYGLTILNNKNAILVGQQASIIDNSFDALSKIIRCKNTNLNDFAIEYVLDYILSVLKYGNNVIYEGKRGKYIYLLKKIDHIKTGDVIKMLNISTEQVPIVGSNFEIIEAMTEKDIDEAIRKAEED